MNYQWGILLALILFILIFDVWVDAIDVFHYCDVDKATNIEKCEFRLPGFN